MSNIKEKEEYSLGFPDRAEVDPGILREKMSEQIRDYHLPRYQELPDVGLYLDQMVQYVNRYLSICSANTLTSSMVSNYVKHKIIPGPKKKTYSKDSLAYLIYASFMKIVMPLDNIRLMEEVQTGSYDLKIAYDYFCEELENMLQFVYGLKEKPDEVGRDHTIQKELLRSSVLALTHKIYLDDYFLTLRGYLENNADE